VTAQCRRGRKRSATACRQHWKGRDGQESDGHGRRHVAGLNGVADILALTAVFEAEIDWRLVGRGAMKRHGRRSLDRGQGAERMELHGARMCHYQPLQGDESQQREDSGKATVAAHVRIRKVRRILRVLRTTRLPTPGRPDHRHECFVRSPEGRGYGNPVRLARTFRAHLTEVKRFAARRVTRRIARQATTDVPRRWELCAAGTARGAPCRRDEQPYFLLSAAAELALPCDAANGETGTAAFGFTCFGFFFSFVLRS